MLLSACVALTGAAAAILFWPRGVHDASGPTENSVSEGGRPVINSATQAAPDIPEPSQPRSFAELYGLQGAPARRVKRPFPSAREAQLREAGLWREGATDGPISMIVEWRDSKPWIRTAIWGVGAEPAGETMDELLNHFLGYRDMDVDAENRLKYLRITGDFVFDEHATRAERIAALEQFAWEDRHIHIAIQEVEVDEKQYVLKGEWKYKPLEGIPWSTEGEQVQTIELYGVDLDKDLAGRKAVSYGSVGQFAGSLSYFVQRNVAIEATGAPERVRWFYNYKGDGTPESAARAHDVDGTILHVCQQTGLRVETETRRARRVKVVEVKGGLLP
jgi:hypothetical protein